MGNITFRNSVSAIVIFAMVISVLGVTTLFSTDNTFAATEASKSKVIVPGNMKYGNSYFIKVEGANYTQMYNQYALYKTKYDLNTINNPNDTLKKDDVSMFDEVKTFYKPNKMTLTTQGHYPRYATFSHKSDGIDKTVGYTLAKNLPAGKYTLTTEFVKGSINILDDCCDPPITYGRQIVYFSTDISDKYVVSNTFYVKSKINFSYNKKKGKLAKSKRTTYKNPTNKFGKLPKPKAKKGYKFVGWYSKKTGGTKITKSTKVPTKNVVTLYARYKKI